MTRRTIAALLGLLALAACRSFDVEREQAFLRYRSEEDVLDLVLVYDGVGAVSDKAEDVEGATRALQGIAGGRRHVLLYDWPFDFDLERLLEDARREADEDEQEDSDLARAFLDYAPGIRLSEARFLTDERGRLCLVQRLRIDHASKGLALLDRFVNRMVLRERDDEEGEVDERAARFVARARQGGRWARFDGAVLEISIPMSPERAARELAELVAAGDSFARWWTEALGALLVTEDEVRLRFLPDREGWIGFAWSDEEPWSGEPRAYRPEVAGRLAEAAPIASGSLAEAVRELKARP